VKKILLSTLTLSLLLPMTGLSADNGKRDWDSKPLLKEKAAENGSRKGSKLYKRPAKPVSVSASYDLFFSSGDTANSFLNQTDIRQGPFDGANSTTLLDDSKSLDADVDVISAAVKILDVLKVSGKLGSGDIKGGKSTVKGIMANRFPRNPELNSEQTDFLFTQSTKGEVDFHDVNIHFNLAALNRAFSPSSDFGLFVGMFNNETKLERTQTNIEVVENLIVNEPAPAGVQKTNIEWDGYRVGLEGGGASPTSLGFSIIYNLMVAGIFQADAEYKDTQPNGAVFSEKGDGGTGFEFDVNAGVQLFNSLNVFFGFRLLDVTADRSSTRGASRQKSDFSMDRKGFYVGAGASF